MITTEQFNQLTQTLPFLKHAHSEMIRELLHQTYSVSIVAGKDIFVEGDPVEAIALLLKGLVRVYKISESGREITLYRFGAGESCILTANAILNQQGFSAIATVEKDAQAIMIPSTIFQRWIREHDLWRNFVFGLLSQRLVKMMEIVDEVAFQRIDLRLARFLLESTPPNHPLSITHQRIADELGSSREVISRLLEQFANAQWIKTGRGTIHILDMEGLNSLFIR